MAPVPGFTRKAIAEWALADLSPGCMVYSNGIDRNAPGVLEPSGAATHPAHVQPTAPAIQPQLTDPIRPLVIEYPLKDPLQTIMDLLVAGKSADRLVQILHRTVALGQFDAYLVLTDRLVEGEQPRLVLTRPTQRFASRGTCSRHGWGISPCWRR